MACNIIAHNVSITVDAQTRMPAITQVSNTSSLAAWHDWTDPGVPSDDLVATVSWSSFRKPYASGHLMYTIIGCSLSEFYAPKSSAGG